ncbi:MAG: GMC oxidoreductase, partial [Gemmatimonadota bacterium]
PPMTYGWVDEERGYMLSTLIDPLLLYPVMMARRSVRAALTWLRWGRTLGVMIKIKDRVSGEIAPDGSIDKPLAEEDRRRLDHGIGVARRILERAGCDPDATVVSPLRGTHPSATARIGELVDRSLQTPVKGLYVCDASVFPEALDAPTVLTIIALGRRLGEHLTGGPLASEPG